MPSDPSLPHATTASDEDLARQAFHFATRHPEHPLSENLRSKARPLSAHAPDSVARLELRVLLGQALATPGLKKRPDQGSTEG